MERTHWARNKTAILTGILAFFSFNPALAQNSIPQLLQDLVSAAHQGNYQQFMSNTTLGTQVLNAALTKSKENLYAQQSLFFHALDCQFGKKPPLSTPLPADPKDTLFRLVDLELLSTTPLASGAQSLRIKTLSRDANNHITTEQNTVMAIQSDNSFKLDLSLPIKCAISAINHRTKVTRMVTQQVFQGKFKNRTAALLALTQGLNEPPSHKELLNEKAL